MRFTETSVEGVLVVEQEPVSDQRGSFSRTYCRREFAEQGVDFRPVQASLSHNRRARTLRGMHYQVPPSPEAKLVRCSRGSLFDVALDVRDESPTFGEWVGAELSADNGVALYVPRGLAHGFLTLEDDTFVHYLIDAFYEAELARGVRWDDPAFGIQWPHEPRVISERDATYPDFRR